MADATELLVENRRLRGLISATHKNGVKHANCDKPYCNICECGLFVCADCGAAEIETEERVCPGAPTASCEELRKAGEFLSERLTEFEQEAESATSHHRIYREWSGHVVPALARFRAALATPEPTADRGREVEWTRKDTIEWLTKKDSEGELLVYRTADDAGLEIKEYANLLEEFRSVLTSTDKG